MAVSFSTKNMRFITYSFSKVMEKSKFQLAQHRKYVKCLQRRLGDARTRQVYVFLTRTWLFNVSPGLCISGSQYRTQCWHVQSLKFFPRVGSAALGMHSFADLYHICVLLDNNVFSQSKVVVPGRCPAPVSLQNV